MNANFVLRVLSITAEHDACSDLHWRTDSDYAPVTFFIGCNDVFYWGCADAETVTPENIDTLEQALKDSEMYGPILFCARVRQMRPQGAMYGYIKKEEWHLFDACGPERGTGLGNPLTPEQAVERKEQ